MRPGSSLFNSEVKDLIDDLNKEHNLSERKIFMFDRTVNLPPGYICVNEDSENRRCIQERREAKKMAEKECPKKATINRLKEELAVVKKSIGQKTIIAKEARDRITSLEKQKSQELAKAGAADKKIINLEKQKEDLIKALERAQRRAS